MRRITALAVALLITACFFAGCSNSNSGDNNTTTNQPASSQATPDASEPDASGTVDTSTSTEGTVDIDALMASLTEAAGLGGTIEVSELDLQASGIDTSNIVNWAGEESKMSSENGGIVMVFQAKAGSASDLAAQLEAYRDARASDDRYAEFAEAIEHTRDARIVEEGDYVVYAVSATGTDGYATLDTTIAEAFS